MKLSANEHDTLLATQKLGGRASMDQLMQSSGLSPTAAMRSVFMLQRKKLVNIREEKLILIRLNDEGKAYARNGLPERRILETLPKKGRQISIDMIARTTGLAKNAIPIALGWLRKKNWGSIDAKKGLVTVPTSERPPGNDEELLKLLLRDGQTNLKSLNPELQSAADTLRKRKILEVTERTERSVSVTEDGLKRIEEGIEVADEVTQLTPELIVTGDWKKVRLTRFDVTAPGPVVYPARVHPVQQVIQRVKEIFAEMGFTEIRGPLVETAFWNFDALFQPQDHPAREMHDTFYLDYPRAGRLPERSTVSRVAETHQDGWKTGSRGWQYPWRASEARKLILRTHTTATTIRYLTRNKEPPVKVFSVDRVYRNEKMDYKSLAEFHQIEGIVMDRAVTFRDLIGTLTEFYSKLGLKKVKFWPSYFPYTEPSAQSTVYIPELNKWFELCGMGIFRPEVTEPLGIEHPVLAWGGGLERLIMVKLGLEDIRFLYRNDLGWIRRTPPCQ